MIKLTKLKQFSNHGIILYKEWICSRPLMIKSSMFENNKLCDDNGHWDIGKTSKYLRYNNVSDKHITYSFPDHKEIVLNNNLDVIEQIINSKYNNLLDWENAKSIGEEKEAIEFETNNFFKVRVLKSLLSFVVNKKIKLFSNNGGIITDELNNFFLAGVTKS